MAQVVKVIELLSESPDSWEAAAQDAVTHATKTIKNIRSVWVHDLQAVVENDKITKYRLSAKISFVIDESLHGHQDLHETHS